MTSPARMLLAVALLSLLLGCAGRDFVRPDQDTLVNGKTTYSQVIEKFGPPRQEGTAIKNDKTVKTMSYGYAAMGGKPVQEDVVPARVMGFIFSMTSWSVKNSCRPGRRTTPISTKTGSRIS